jgi:hypothetical protein
MGKLLTRNTNSHKREIQKMRKLEILAGLPLYAMIDGADTLMLQALG